MLNPDFAAQTRKSRVAPRPFADYQTTQTDFNVLSSPRQVRVIRALLTGERSRESIDSIAAASNGPEIIRQLRKAGLEVPCRRIVVTNRDGGPSRPGIYRLSAADVAKLADWGLV